MGRKINNEFYDQLEDRWYEDSNHPIALLRSENAARTPWILQKIDSYFGKHRCQILDIGCGGGFLTNPLAEVGHQVTGIDLSEKSLSKAREMDRTKSVIYLQADAYKLPFTPQSFDVVSALDLLEHVEQPEKIVQNAAKLLKPGGLFFFHTFNRNFLSYIFVIKGVEWFVKNTPKNMHVYNLFIKPEELNTMIEKNQMKKLDIVGVSPVVKSFAFWKMLLTRKVPAHFKFAVHSSLNTGYLGVAKKLE